GDARMIDHDLPTRPRGLERSEWHPEGVLHFRALEDGRTGRQREYKWTYHNRGEDRGSWVQIVEDAEPLRARQVNADFFARFANRSREQIGICGLAPAARKRDLSRPDIARAHGAVNEEGFEAVVAVVQDHGDRGCDHPLLKRNRNRLV